MPKPGSGRRIGGLVVARRLREHRRKSVTPVRHVFAGVQTRGGRLVVGRRPGRAPRIQNRPCRRRRPAHRSTRPRPATPARRPRDTSPATHRRNPRSRLRGRRSQRPHPTIRRHCRAVVRVRRRPYRPQRSQRSLQFDSSRRPLPMCACLCRSRLAGPHHVHRLERSTSSRVRVR